MKRLIPWETIYDFMARLIYILAIIIKLTSPEKIKAVILRLFSKNYQR